MRNYEGKPIQSNEWMPLNELKQLYIDEGKTKEELKVLYNTTFSSITRALKYYNLHKTRKQVTKSFISDMVKKNKKELTEKIPYNKLYKFYIEEEHNTQETAEYFGVTISIIRSALDYYNVHKTQEQIKAQRGRLMNEKYGVTNIFEKTDYIQQKTYEKLGVYNSSLLETTLEKRKATCQEKYGGNAPSCNEQIKNKTKQTNQERYGGNAPICSEDIMNKVKATNLEKYGTEYIGASEQVKEKKKQTCQERYGVDNAMLIPQFKEKAKETCLEKYGNEYYSKTEECKEKVKQTCLDKYGVDNFMKSAEFKEKSIQTMLIKYGVEHPSQSEKIIAKTDATCLDKYGVKRATQLNAVKELVRNTNKKLFGVDYYTQTDEYKQQYKQTCLDKYGVESVSKVPEIRQKAKETCLERYGVEHYSQTPQCIQKTEYTNMQKYGVPHYSQTEEYLKRSKQTCLEKYGVEHPMLLPEIVLKGHETAKRNGNAGGKSKLEDTIYELLKQKFNIIDRQHYDAERYPYMCDFYLQELDLFIEIQGYQGHGGHVFNPNDKEDQEKLAFWEKKAEENKHKGNKNQYAHYIYIWTIDDVEKRYTAYKNNLNYLEFFNMKEFKVWFDSLP